MGCSTTMVISNTTLLQYPLLLQLENSLAQPEGWGGVWHNQRAGEESGVTRSPGRSLAWSDGRGEAWHDQKAGEELGMTRRLERSLAWPEGQEGAWECETASRQSLLRWITGCCRQLLKLILLASHSHNGTSKYSVTSTARHDEQSELHPAKSVISLLAVSCLIAVVIEHTFNIVTEYGMVFLHDPCLQLLVQLCSCGMSGARVLDTSLGPVVW